MAMPIHLGTNPRNHVKHYFYRWSLEDFYYYILYYYCYLVAYIIISYYYILLLPSNEDIYTFFVYMQGFE